MRRVRARNVLEYAKQVGIDPGPSDPLKPPPRCGRSRTSHEGPSRPVTAAKLRPISPAGDAAQPARSFSIPVSIRRGQPTRGDPLPALEDETHRSLGTTPSITRETGELIQPAPVQLDGAVLSSLGTP